MKQIAWKTWAVVQIALLLTLLAFPPQAHAALVDTNLIVRYYMDEAASGNPPPPNDVLDGSGVGSDFDLAITNDGTNFVYNEISGDRGLECVATDGNQIANKAINDSSDKVRDNINGKQKITIEVVARVDDFSSSNGRMFAINLNDSSDANLGIAGNSGTNMRIYWEQTLLRSINPGATRAVWHIVYDTTQSTANDRVKIYKNGSLQSPTVDANPALNDTLSLDTGTYIVMFNRGADADRNRSMNGVLFYAALYGDYAFTQANVTTNYDILTLDDDTPTPSGGVGITGPIVVTGPIKVI